MQDISIISLAFTLILALGCLFLILSPLFKWDAFLNFTATGQDLSQTKEALFTTLNEIEFEYKMDKISHVDYKNLKKQYESQIAEIMKEEEYQIDNKVDKDLLAEVEREIEATIKNYNKKKGE
ncbi:MAG TPA: hypothetical protein VJ558_00305 [Bacillales bacterium]|nr:hypothetical protein [Bacillales bacterium]